MLSSVLSKLRSSALALGTGQVVLADDLPRVTRPNGHCKIAEFGIP